MAIAAPRPHHMDYLPLMDHFFERTIRVVALSGEVDHENMVKYLFFKVVPFLIAGTIEASYNLIGKSFYNIKVFCHNSNWVSFSSPISYAIASILLTGLYFSHEPLFNAFSLMNYRIPIIVGALSIGYIFANQEDPEALDFQSHSVEVISQAPPVEFTYPVECPPLEEAGVISGTTNQFSSLKRASRGTQSCCSQALFMLKRLFTEGGFEGFERLGDEAREKIDETLIMGREIDSNYRSFLGRHLDETAGLDARELLSVEDSIEAIRDLFTISDNGDLDVKALNDNLYILEQIDNSEPIERALLSTEVSVVPLNHEHAKPLLSFALDRVTKNHGGKMGFTLTRAGYTFAVFIDETKPQPEFVFYDSHGKERPGDEEHPKTAAYLRNFGSLEELIKGCPEISAASGGGDTYNQLTITPVWLS